jgi:hypothetical protein
MRVAALCCSLRSMPRYTANCNTKKTEIFQGMSRQGLGSPLVSIPVPGILVGVTKLHDPQAILFTELRGNTQG